MKISMWFGYNPLIFFFPIFCFVNLVFFFFFLYEMLSNTDCFETLEMFSESNEDVYVILV